MSSKLLTLSLLAGLVLAPVAADAAALPVVTGSTRWYDARPLDNGKKLDVTGRVIRREIHPPIIRVQTQTFKGTGTVLCRAVQSNLSAVQTHCDRSRTADGDSSSLCHYVPEAQCFPTISK